MIKILLIVFLSFSLWASEEEDCETDVSTPAIKMAEELAVPNCITKNNLYKAKSGSSEELCQNCKSKFEKNSNKSIPSFSKTKKQETFFNSALEEYKKLVTNNLISTARLRALMPTGAKYENSLKSCQPKTSEDFIKGCHSETAKKLFKNSTLLQSLQRETSNELAKILSKDDYQAPSTLLNRSKASCFVPEKDILLIASSNVEEALTPDLIEYFKSPAIEKLGSVEEIFSSDDFISKFGDKSELRESVVSHPLLAEYFKSPKSIATFFKTLPQNASTADLRKTLYSKNSGELFDKSLAESCEKSFRALQENICSKEFESGDLTIDPFNNYNKLFSEDLKPSKDKFATSEDLLQKNFELLGLCESSSISSRNLTTCNEVISNFLPQRYKEQNINSFKDDKFATEIGSINESICSVDDNKCPAGSKDISCKAFLKYKELKNIDSLESKLANSSNKEVNDLLRSMIGDPKNLDPKTKEILVLQGILPKDDGTLVAQAEIPERQPGYFNQAPASQTQAKVTTPIQPAAASARTASSSRSQQSASSDSSNWTGQPTTSSIPDLSDYYKNQKEMDDIESEIMRRLSSMPEQKPASKAAAKKIARDAYAKTGRSMPTALEDYYANRMMGQYNAPSVSGSSDFEDAANTGSGPRREASVSNTDSAAEKWKKDGMNRALADMHGAKQAAAAGAGRNPASTNDDANAKALTTVALNIAEDPKVTLSQSLAEKINKNDPETQLLQVLVKNKSNFILQMKSVNFKVIFDDQKKLRLLVDSGDPKEAERLRPQLELFFKRLSAL
ncbi:hypothetical protein [Peredibacter starrii]|uniref:Uncharacterized protein n=1 Tax=Peredibacter starrii TaxID=28202 RepID=A0AAX4HL29_9BACT|nr:hypothetical protein [Peredibacter starrii]WPU63843.1 hypothetical protein SOO65_14200 [Peredibacter starrii]